MTLPAWLSEVLPPDTAQSWEELAPVVPSAVYLGGGTAIAVHIQHRVSRDLDFFFHENAVDLDALAEQLEQTGKFAVARHDQGTLNGLYSETKVQFLHADEGAPQALLADPALVEGLRIAGLPDLIAMKLKVIPQRPELRDYFDLMAIEEATGITVEEGLGYYLARFKPRDGATQIAAIVRALGYLDDVDPDELLPVSKSEIARYWRERQPEILKSAGWLTHGGSPPAPTFSTSDGADARHWVQPHTRGGRKISGYFRGR